MLQVSLFFKPSHHINLYIYGFKLLQQNGILRINSIEIKPNCTDKILRAVVNGVKFVYDGYDGDQADRSFFSFSDYAWCDFYFKRSFSASIAKKYPKCRPAGFNYNLTPDYSLFNRLNNRYKRLLGKGVVRHSDLESLPVPAEKPKILFLTGLWDPREDPSIAGEIEQINATRLLILKTLREGYKDISTFGVRETRFSRKTAAGYLADNVLTNRRGFIAAIKKHDICITSTGLHYSTGWRLAEYIAASRAIISEPLHYQTTGDFHQHQNYAPFSSGTSLEHAINHLLNNEERQRMMIKNYIYYHNNLRPDSLILQTIGEAWH